MNIVIASFHIVFPHSNFSFAKWAHSVRLQLVCLQRTCEWNILLCNLWCFWLFETVSFLSRFETWKTLNFSFSETEFRRWTSMGEIYKTAVEHLKFGFFSNKWKIIGVCWFASICCALDKRKYMKRSIFNATLKRFGFLFVDGISAQNFVIGNWLNKLRQQQNGRRFERVPASKWSKQQTMRKKECKNVNNFLMNN